MALALPFSLESMLIGQWEFSLQVWSDALLKFHWQKIFATEPSFVTNGRLL